MILYNMYEMLSSRAYQFGGSNDPCSYKVCAGAKEEVTGAAATTRPTNFGSLETICEATRVHRPLTLKEPLGPWTPNTHRHR
jgi:hypothetical protein